MIRWCMLQPGDDYAYELKHVLYPTLDGRSTMLDNGIPMDSINMMLYFKRSYTFRPFIVLHCHYFPSHH